jgi:hypothetical protein
LKSTLRLSTRSRKGQPLPDDTTKQPISASLIANLGNTSRRVSFDLKRYPSVTFTSAPTSAVRSSPKPDHRERSRPARLLGLASYRAPRRRAPPPLNYHPSTAQTAADSAIMARNHRPSSLWGPIACAGLRQVKKTPPRRRSRSACGMPPTSSAPIPGSSPRNIPRRSWA